MIQYTDVIYANTTWPDKRPPASGAFFAQVGCTSVGGNESSYMTSKRNIGLMCSTIGLMMCIFYRLTISRIKADMNIEEKILDYELVSIEDYSVYGHISPELYRNVVEKEDAESKEHLSDPEERRRWNVPIRKFKRFLIDQLESNLADKDTNEQGKVADIAFSFNNREMLKLLQKRANYLTRGKY